MECQAIELMIVDDHKITRMGMKAYLGEFEAIRVTGEAADGAKADIVTLSKLMGHTSLQVLTRYLKQIGEDLAKAARETSPVDLHF